MDLDNFPFHEELPRCRKLVYETLQREYERYAEQAVRRARGLPWVTPGCSPDMNPDPYATAYLNATDGEPAIFGVDWADNLGAVLRVRKVLKNSIPDGVTIISEADALTLKASQAKIVDCGRRPGYLPEKTRALLLITLEAKRLGKLVTWG